MINKEEVQLLLDQLYEYMTFKEGEEPHFDRLKNLFVNGALVIEYIDEACQQHIQKDIGKHIEEMNKVFTDYPQIKSKGFSEKELSNTITIYGPMAHVRSQYEKKYFNGKNDIRSTGTNCIHLAKLNKELKIVSIGWYEN